MGNDDLKKCTVHCVCFSGFSKFNFWISTRYTQVLMGKGTFSILS